MDESKRIAELEAQVAMLREALANIDNLAARVLAEPGEDTATLVGICTVIESVQDTAAAYERYIRTDERRKVLGEFKQVCVKAHDAIPTAGTSTREYYDGIEAAMLSMIDGIDAELAAIDDLAPEGD